MNTLFNPKIFLLAIVAFLLQSCYADKGNYDYMEINEIAIAGIPDSCEVLEYGKLTIIPELTGTLSNNENDYSYEWIAIQRKDDNTPGAKLSDTIARTRNLENFPVPLFQNEYDVHYRVTDITTGVRFEKKFYLKVNTKISEGFLIMNDMNGMMRLDMLSWREGKFNYISDVLTDMGSELPSQQGPIKVVTFPDAEASPPYDNNGYAIYLLNRTGANRIHPRTFGYDPLYNIKYHFYSLSSYPSDFVAENMYAGHGGAHLLYSKGNMYLYTGLQGSKWGIKANTLDGINFFKVSPVMATSFSGNVVFGDETKTFYYSTASSYRLQNPASSDLRDLNPALKLVYMSSHPSGYNYSFVAILKDTVLQKSYWLSMLVSNQGVVVETPLTEIEEASAPGFYNAGHYAIGGEFIQYIFYSSGSKLYVYDTGAKQFKEIANQSGKQITFLNYQWFTMTNAKPIHVELSKNLLVGWYDSASSSGTLERYSIPNLLTGNFRSIESFSGFGKIVSIDYKAAN